MVCADPAGNGGVFFLRLGGERFVPSSPVWGGYQQPVELAPQTSAYVNERAKYRAQSCSTRPT